MTFMHLELEEWELLPDDNYDGALEMTRRGRIMFLTKIYNENSYVREEK